MHLFGVGRGGRAQIHSVFRLCRSLPPFVLTSLGELLIGRFSRCNEVGAMCLVIAGYVVIGGTLELGLAELPDTARRGPPEGRS